MTRIIVSTFAMLLVVTGCASVTETASPTKDSSTKTQGEAAKGNDTTKSDKNSKDDKNGTTDKSSTSGNSGSDQPVHTVTVTRTSSKQKTQGDAASPKSDSAQKATKSVAWGAKNREFRTPSKTVWCRLNEDHTVLCAPKSIKYKIPSKPERCGDVDFGDGITILRSGKGSLACIGDVPYNPKAPVVAAGTTMASPKGNSCVVAKDFVMCSHKGIKKFTYSDSKFLLH